MLLVIACVISAAVAWALWDGMTTSQPRGGYAAAITLLLPVGAGWCCISMFELNRELFRIRVPNGESIKLIEVPEFEAQKLSLSALSATMTKPSGCSDQSEARAAKPSQDVRM